ncbi:MAG: helix-turn-helix transcriptional regulator [Tenericutes bacterium]|nr:helix-turn-helix transcriptional regulator [Mycoplasmatota bacterium]
MNQDVIIKNLILLRKANNLTQKELAIKLNYSDKIISKWERGESLPDIIALNDISKYYNIKIDDLVNSLYNKDLSSNDISKIEIRKVKEPAKVLIWSLFLAIILVIVCAWVGGPYVAIIAGLLLVLYSVIISIPISHFEWEVNYKDNIFRVVNKVTRTELWKNEKKVDEVYRLLAVGIKLTSKVEEETLIVNVVSGLIEPKCKVLIN